MPEMATAANAGMTDRLEYLADLLLELQSIAVTCNCDTLAGLLALSHAEALRQARCCQPRRP